MSNEINAMIDGGPLDYEVATYQETNPMTGEKLPFFATYRTDTNQVFKTGFSSLYHPIQNKDAFQVIQDMSQITDVELVKTGVWKNGAEAYAQVNLNGGFSVGGAQDRIDKRLTFYNTHDGKGSLAILITPYRYFCHNQVAMSLRNAEIDKTMLKIKHMVSGEDRLKTLAEQYKIIDGVFHKTEENFNELADKKIKKEHVTEVLNRLFPTEDVGKYKVARNEKAQEIIAGIFANADNGKISYDTGWNLYNSITNYTNHHVTGDERSLLLGTNSKKNITALEAVNDVCLDNILSQVREPDPIDNILSQVEI